MIVPIFLPHLGCRERCIYCDQGYITDVRQKAGSALAIGKQLIVNMSMADSISSLDKAKEKVEVGLYGGNIFGVKPADLKALFEYFNDYTEKISNFRISTKPIPLNSEIIRILKENRVTVIELGIPIFNNAILEKLNRRHTVEDFYKAFYALKNEGFNVALQVMVGLPDETMDDIKETAEQIIRLSPHYIRIYPLIVLKETPLHKMYERRLFTPIPFEEAVKRAAYIYLSALLHNIKVVKMGLTDNEVIKDRVVDGHYHPAFGYMVKSQVFYLAIKLLIDKASIEGDVTVQLNNSDIPHLLGYKRSNIERFKKQRIQITWEKENIEQGNFILHWDSKTVKGSIFDALSAMQN